MTKFSHPLIRLLPSRRRLLASLVGLMIGIAGMQSAHPQTLDAAPLDISSAAFATAQK